MAVLDLDNTEDYDIGGALDDKYQLSALDILIQGVWRAKMKEGHFR